MTKQDKSTPMKRRLRELQPNAWAVLIRNRIREPILCAWIASIVMWHMPERMRAFESQLLDMSDEYRPDDNHLTSLQLQGGFYALGIPYVISKADDAKPHKGSGGRRHADSRIVRKESVGTGNTSSAVDCIRYHKQEQGKAS